jgi:hexosaminidase
MDASGVNYRIPDVMGLEQDRLTLEDSVVLELAAPVAGGEVLYTTDGSLPGAGSATYLGPLRLAVPETGLPVAARVRLDDGRMGAVRRARISRTELLPSRALPRSRRVPGLAVQGFRGSFRIVDLIFQGRALDLAGAGGEGPSTVPRVTLLEGVPDTNYGLRLTGFVRVPRSGIYTFYLSSDDGSRLTIQNRTVVNHDGPHSMSEAAGPIALHRGWHPLEVLYFQAGGGSGLTLEVEGPGVSRRQVPAHWLAHFPEDSRPSSPERP